MRPWEVVLLAALAVRVAAVLGRGPWGAAWRGLAAFVAGAAWVAHLALEGPRWPLAPAYAATVLFVALLPFERPHPEAARLLLGRNRRKRDPLPRPRAFVGALVVAVAGLLAWALPVPTLPAPTGPWAVGSVDAVLDLADAAGASVGAGGRTLVRLWYPVDPAAAAGPWAPWVAAPDRVLPALAASGGLPRWALGHLALVRTHATWGAPPARPEDPAGWPVVTFDHGLGGFRSQNTFLAEELASHGAVVVAVEHPGGGLGAALPDGAARPYEGLPPSGDPGYAAAVAALGARWTAETVAVLDALGRLASDGPLGGFAGALDLGRVLTTGHSTGGTVAVDVCAALARCFGSIALDPWWGPLAAATRAAGPSRPLVVLASDPVVGYFGPENRAAFEAFVARGGAAVVDLVVARSGHHDLNDTAALSPVAHRFGHSTGPVPAARAFAAVRAVALAALEAGAGLRGADPADEALSATVAAAVLRAAAGHPVLAPGGTDAVPDGTAAAR